MKDSDIDSCSKTCSPDEPIAGHYFVSAYPPFSTWSSDKTNTVSKALSQAPIDANTPSFGLYVHIPFCVERCQYCYYLSYAGKSKQHMADYADALVAELGLYCRTPALVDRHLSFVYFGGGTPSLLPDHALNRLMKGLQSVAPWDHVEEVTFECAPKTATQTKMQILKDNGVTRLSLGVQAMDDDILRKNGRVHLTRDVEQAIDAIHGAGFRVVNIDLIAGLIGENEESFLRSLDRSIDLKPDSITIYQLEIPMNTPLYRNLQSGQLNDIAATWDEKRRRVGLAFDHLENSGYHVQNAYSAVRDPNKHRFVYQDQQYVGADLLGIGQASFSYINGVHFQNEAKEQAYFERLQKETMPIKRAYQLNDDERLIREFILQLKLGGIDGDYFMEKFHVNVRDRFAEPLAKLEQAGWIELDAANLILTRAGLLRVDRLLEKFYLPCHRNIRYS